MTRTPLGDMIRPRPQFARSVNLERDTAAGRLEGYLPTARALETLRRVGTAMSDRTLTRAWSITGPYGSGKSSLALLLDSLAGPSDDPKRTVANAAISDVEPVAADIFDSGLRSVAPAAGLIRAVATAQREPASRTIVRALIAGLRRYPAAQRRRNALLIEAESLLDAVPLSARAVADLLGEVAAIAPVLLIIDEFGKNLEFFTDRAGDADLFVLQEVAERATGESGLPVYFLTLQHLAFEEYASAASAVQRREWAKVQGRFEDIPFADSPSELLQLVSRVMRPTPEAHDRFLRAISRWAVAEHKRLAHLGFADRLPSADLLASCYPLHPLTLAVLPEVCSRYGQRERTLFSFLARPEPHSVPTFLAETSLNLRNLPTVGVDSVFDYFMASAGTILGSTDGASRWLEIDSRIRETQGLSDDEQRVLKVVGILNLASRGGSLRASRGVLDYTFPEMDLDTILGDLEARGLLVHRSFADEYRIWQGSDFDLQGSIDDARRRLSGESIAAVCERALSLSPIVASRHSQDKGILRFFTRCYAAAGTRIRVPKEDDQADGVLVYVVDGSSPQEFVFDGTSSIKPVLFVHPSDVAGLRAAAMDAAAIAEVLATSDSLRDDWVARRELHERGAVAAGRFRSALDDVFTLDTDATSVCWPDGTAVETAGRRTWSAVLSEVCDTIYSAAPTVRSEMLARRELSSQAARARRDLLIAMTDRQGIPRLGIEGYGPERAMLEAVLVHSGIYREAGGAWQFGSPSPDSDYLAAWASIDGCLNEAQDRLVGLDEVWRTLEAPPIGLPDGPIPVLVTAALLAHADDIAVYQDGTFQPMFGSELIERMVKTPVRFAIKRLAIPGSRARVIDAVTSRLASPTSTPNENRNSTLIRALTPLIRSIRDLSDYARLTSSVSDTAQAVRAALMQATEPDELLFDVLPRAVGLRPISPATRVTEAKASEFADKLADAVEELRGAYPVLLADVVNALASGIGRPTPSSVEEIRTELRVRASGLVDRVLEPRLRSFLLAASDTALEDTDWLENLAMNVAERPPAAWRDQDRRRFEAHLPELLAAYRRVEMLHLEHLDAPNESVVARQVLVTTPEGHSTGGVVWLDQDAALEIEDIVEEAVTAAASRVGSHAAEALLASLAERVVDASAPRLLRRDGTNPQEIGRTSGRANG